jgi:hypothetical protein
MQHLAAAITVYAGKDCLARWIPARFLLRKKTGMVIINNAEKKLQNNIF